MTAQEYKRTTLTGKTRSRFRPGVDATHKWIYRHYGKASYCSNDKSHSGKRFEWANLSGDYKRDISDWKQLCPSCHRKMDYTEAQRKFLGQRSRGNIAVNRKSVVQLSLDGEVVGKFDHIYEASSKTGIIRTGILNVLSGRAKTSGGFYWKYGGILL